MEKTFSMSGGIKNGIFALNPINVDEVCAISLLHMELLPKSFVCQFGWNFMTNIYYKNLVSDGLLDAFLYFHNNKAVGFISFTRFPDSFMSKGLKHYFIKILIYICVELITKPKFLISLIGAIQISRQRMVNNKESYAELLSIGVKKEYRKKITINTRLNVAINLIKSMAIHLMQFKIKKIIVITDKNNVAGILFYKQFMPIDITSHYCNVDLQITYKIDVQSILNFVKI